MSNQKEMLSEIIVKTLKPYFERLEDIERKLEELKDVHYNDKFKRR